MNLTLTKEEITVLTQLIDLAVKAGGIQVAQVALYFTNKLNPPPVTETKNAE